MKRGCFARLQPMQELAAIGGVAPARARIAPRPHAGSLSCGKGHSGLGAAAEYSQHCANTTARVVNYFQSGSSADPCPWSLSGAIPQVRAEQMSPGKASSAFLQLDGPFPAILGGTCYYFAPFYV